MDLRSAESMESSSRTTGGGSLPKVRLARPNRVSRSERPPNKRVKLAARSLRGRTAVVRQCSSVERLITGAPGRAGRRSLRAGR
jgi:hypothetical protein